MGLRLHRVTNEQWLRLAASRRSYDLPAAPPRAAISAIESELLVLGGPEPSAPAADEFPEAAAG